MIISEIGISETEIFKNDSAMKFYNREKEINQLNETQQRSLNNAQFTVVTGRRRIGKTHLLLHATAGRPTLYFFVARKAENFLCQDFVQEIKEKLGTPILGEVSSFGKLFEYLMYPILDT